MSTEYQLEIYPWLISSWEQLLSVWHQNIFPHAMIIRGLDGLGQDRFAENLAKHFLCIESKKAWQPCQNCHSCHLTQANTHPDLKIIQPEEKSTTIKIDQIREVVEFVHGTAMLNGFRIIIINPANAMNTQAANALLKTLEEPTENVFFILVTNQNNQLPPTILSRCQKFTLTIPPKELGLKWLESKTNNINNELLLKIAAGAPLNALAFSNADFLALRNTFYLGLYQLQKNQKDPISLAAELQNHSTEILLNLLQLWIGDLYKLKVTGNPGCIINTDFQKNLIELSSTISYSYLNKFLDKINKNSRYLMQRLNLNRQLLLEDIFISWKIH